MRETNKKRSLTPIAMAIMIICMSGSSTILVPEAKVMIEEREPHYTHGTSNIPGFTAGSIYSDATISNGRGTVCMVTHSETIKCWGANKFGQLGNGLMGHSNLSDTPVDVDGVSNLSFREVAAGYDSVCAITDTDELYCWGSGWMGQLGRFTCEQGSDDNLPCINHAGKPPQKVQFPGNATVQTVAGSEMGHYCAILENGSVSCWGANGWGQLGYSWTDASQNNRFCTYMYAGNPVDAPDDQCNYFQGIAQPNIVEMPAGREAIAVSVGATQSCVVLDDNSVYCWGMAAQMGQQPSKYKSTTTELAGPATTSLNLSDASNFSSEGGIATIQSQGLGSWQFYWTGKTGDTLTGFGWYNGILPGDGAYSFPVGSEVTRQFQHLPVHVPMPEGQGALALDAGGPFTTAILENGSLAFWGQGWGQTMGTQPTLSTELPENRTALSFTQSGSFGCAILDGFEAWCGGQNVQGQLGNGGTDSSGASTPLGEVDGDHEFVAITAMNQWYSDDWGPNPSNEYGSTESACAITTDAMVYCWGANTVGQLGSYQTASGGLSDPFSSSLSPDPIHQAGNNLAYLSERDPDGDGILTMADDLPYGCPAGYFLDSDPLNCTGVASPGYFSLEYSEEEEACQPGFYQPLPAQSSCIEANPGHFVSDSAADHQTECDVGHYQADSAQTSCIASSPGFHVPSTGSLTQITCWVGSFQPSYGQSTCIDADPGHYVLPNSSPTTSQIECPLGKYQPDYAQTSCISASPGHFVNLTGSHYQTECPLGTYQSGSGASKCIEASSGRFVNLTGSTTETLCPAGTYQPQKAQTSCIQSDPGNYTYFDGATSQIPCPSGQYQGSSGQSSCNSSAPGYYSPPGSTSQIQCPAGTYSEYSNQAECTPADPGNFVDLDGATGQTPCPEGQYQSESGSGSCIEPPPGQIASADGSSTVSCTPGNYRPEGQSSCIPASAGHYVSDEGASSQTPCEPGTYRSTPGKTSCVEAAPGTFVPEAGAMEPTQCPEGQYQSNQGQQSCQPAMPGHHVPEQGAMSQTSCRPGKYQPDQGQETCLNADPGNFVQSSGATSQMPCEPGSYQSSEGSRNCDLADPGNFVDQQGATEQTPCPSGQEQEFSGQSECTDVERPLLLTLLMFAVPSVVLGTMAVLYISGRRKEAGGRGKAYMYSEDLTVGQLRKGK